MLVWARFHPLVLSFVKYCILVAPVSFQEAIFQVSAHLVKLVRFEFLLCFAFVCIISGSDIGCVESCWRICLRLPFFPFPL